MRIAFYSTMMGMAWGGSEELWSRAATVLLERGHEVCVSYRRHRTFPPQLRRLQSLGAKVHLRRAAAYGRTIRRVLDHLHLGQHGLRRWLHEAKPDMVVVSSGYHTDDLHISSACRALGIPYSLLLQAAGSHDWIHPAHLESHRAAYAGAAHCYFVSEQNRDIVEANLAIDLSGAEIVANPFNVPRDAAPAWPSAAESWKLACVARLHFKAKGQDLLLQALRQPKWRARPLEIVLWGGDGGSGEQIEKLIALYGLQRQIRVGGFADDVESLWQNHHGLILPSRYEGNALAMIEAMMCGRVPIVTNVGRVAELVDDNVTGFVAPAATVELIDDALERAWQRREDWQAMGARAGHAIRARHSLQPAEDFAEALLAAASSRPAALSRAA